MNSILILGSTSDIAVSVARLYAARKYNVMLAARNAANQSIVANDLRVRYNTSVEEYLFDAELLNTHASFYENLKTKPDIVVCVFGYLGENEKAMHNQEECQRILMANYNGAVSILNIVATDMEKRREGTIIGISSVAGDRGRQSNFIYGSAKAGFTAYLAGLRNRMYHKGVHVATIKPGFVATKMTAGLKLPPALTASPRRVAIAVYKAHSRKQNIVYVLWMWRYIMLLIIHIPEFIFKKMKM